MLLKAKTYATLNDNKEIVQALSEAGAYSQESLDQLSKSKKKIAEPGALILGVLGLIALCSSR